VKSTGIRNQFGQMSKNGRVSYENSLGPFLDRIGDVSAKQVLA
jgi:hypothetical protein